MDIKKLQKKVIVKSGIILAILVFIAAASFSLQSLKTRISDNRDLLKNEISFLSRKIQTLSEKSLQASDAVNVWKDLGDDKKQMQGLQINKGKDLIDKYEKQYRLSNMKVSFSKPTELGEEYKTETVSAISSSVNLSFGGLTDQHVFNFIEALLNDFPGYIQITSFSMTRKSDVTKSALEMLSRGETPALVEVNMSFSWRDMQYKGPAEENGGNAL